MKLSGRWLSEIGFTPDQRVTYIVNNALVIDLENRKGSSIKFESLFVKNIFTKILTR
ncbi:hypothetical protein CS542_03660 [Pedobacter sp. IW39]|nr:hypothetical protein CS542_03660 [Pedobacter sp. IW39]